MTAEEYSYLIFKKYREGLDPEEAAQVEQWQAESPENQRAAAEIEAIFKASAPVAPPVDTQAELLRLKNRLRAEAAPGMEVTHRSRALRPWIRAAAAVVVLVVGAVLFFKKPEKAALENLVASATGTKQLQITLPDGSTATLRQDAELRYPPTFEGQARRLVQLSGEAFFDVQKNAAQPFVVVANGIETQVLGTKFNVRDRNDETEAEVAVSEGLVQVTLKNGSSARVAAGQRAAVDKNRQELTILPVETEAIADWRGEELSFRETPLAGVVERLSRRFGQKIEMDNPALARGCPYSAYFPKADLDAVLKNLELVFGFRVERRSGTIVLTGGRCPG